MATTNRVLSGTGLRVYHTIRAYVAEHGYLPSVRDLQEICDISSTSVVTYHLRILEGMGLIERQPGKARALRIVEERNA